MNNLYYDMYRNLYSKKINESSISDLSSGNTESILTLGKIKMYVSDLDKVMDVELKPIVNAVNSALGKISSKYTFMYSFIQYSRPQYVLANPADARCIHKTMAVDNVGNLWMNVHFIYNNLHCDPDKIFGILFHELMHNFLQHIERSKKVMPREAMEELIKKSPMFAKNEHIKQNLCQDYEVNCNMVDDGVVTKDFWNEFGGFYADKYVGKMWEEIYKTDGDMILKDYLSRTTGMTEEYFECMKAILEAMKVLYDKYSTDKEKEIAKEKLKEALEKFGLLKKKKESDNRILDALRRFQKSRVKEIGEIAVFLKAVVDDFLANPKNFEPSDLEKVKNDIEALKEEFGKNIKEVSDFSGIASVKIEGDISDCFDTLYKNSEKIATDKELNDVDIKKLEDEVIFKLDSMFADRMKKKELEKKREELRKKREEEMKALIDEKEKSHLLKKYFNKLEEINNLFYASRISERTSSDFNVLMSMVSRLLKVYKIEEIGEEIKTIGAEKFDDIINKLSVSLKDDLMELKKSGILVYRDEAYFDEILDSLVNDNIKMFKSFDGGKSETELVSIIMIAIASLNRVKTELTQKPKYRASDEYKEEYSKEYKRLKKIYDELGEKGLKRELGM